MAEFFFVHEFEKKHEIFYELRQLNEKKIKKTFYENHFKTFKSQTKHLIEIMKQSLILYQTIRKFKTKKKKVYLINDLSINDLSINDLSINNLSINL